MMTLSCSVDSFVGMSPVGLGRGLPLGIGGGLPLGYGNLGSPDGIRPPGGVAGGGDEVPVGGTVSFGSGTGLGLGETCLSCGVGLSPTSRACFPVVGVLGSGLDPVGKVVPVGSGRGLPLRIGGRLPLGYGNLGIPDGIGLPSGVAGGGGVVPVGWTVSFGSGTGLGLGEILTSLSCGVGSSLASRA